MRLIDADALKERAVRVSTVKEHCYMKAVGTKEIDKAPTMDAALVLRGRWKPYGQSEPYIFFTCSLCDQFQEGETPFCPYCGARMLGG